MATTLVTVDLTKVEIVRRTQYVTRALNRMAGMVSPRGVIRGFKPVTSASALHMELHADDLAGESVAVIRGKSAGDREAILYKEEGDLTLDLTAHAGTTIYVALYKDYTVGADTEVLIRAYSAAEFAAGTTDEAVLLCKVDVPASGTIPATAIDFLYRDTPQMNRGEFGGEELVPILNAQFDDYAEDLSTSGSLRSWQITTATASIDAAASRFRRAGLRLSTSAAAAVIASFAERADVKEGEKLLFALSYRPGASLSWSTGLQVRVDFFTSAGGATAANSTQTFTSTVTDWQYEAWSVDVPAGAVRASFTLLATFDAGSFDIEALQVFAQRVAAPEASLVDFVGTAQIGPVRAGRLSLYEGASSGFAAGTAAPPFVMYASPSTADMYIRRPGGGDLFVGEVADPIDLFVTGQGKFDDAVAVNGTPGGLGEKLYVGGEIVVTGPNIVLAGNTGNASLAGNLTLTNTSVFDSGTGRLETRWLRATDIVYTGSLVTGGAFGMSTTATGGLTGPNFTGGVTSSGAASPFYSPTLMFNATSTYTFSFPINFAKSDSPNGMFLAFFKNNLNMADAWTVEMTSVNLDTGSIGASPALTASGTIGPISGSGVLLKQILLTSLPTPTAADGDTYIVKVTFTPTSGTQRHMFGVKFQSFVRYPLDHMLSRSVSF